MSLRVILVEDDEDQRELLAELLGRAHFQVTVAASVQEARALLEASAFDVLLVDGFLGDGTARDVLRNLTTSQTPPVCILMTGQSSHDEAVDSTHFDARLVKPVGGDALNAVMLDTFEAKTKSRS